jgi:hypothetical protein
MPGAASRRWPEALLIVALLGCTARRGSDPPAQPRRDDALSVAAPTPDVGRFEDSADTASVARPETGVLVVDDPSVLVALEAAGASLGAMLGGPVDPPLDNSALAKLPRYASMLQVLEADIAEIALADPNAGVSVARSSHRLFDKRWPPPR